MKICKVLIHSWLNLFFCKIILLGFIFLIQAEAISQQKTYCNPINLDYGYTPFEANTAGGKHRATADPVIVNFKNKYFLFFGRKC